MGGSSTVAVVDMTEGLQGQSVMVAAPVPDILNVEPEKAAETGGGSATIRGRNFAPDSEVLFGGMMVPSQFIDSRTIVASIPPSPVDIPPLSPEFIDLRFDQPLWNCPPSPILRTSTKPISRSNSTPIRMV
jgi:hypothetical protein